MGYQGPLVFGLFLCGCSLSPLYNQSETGSVCDMTIRVELKDHSQEMPTGRFYVVDCLRKELKEQLLLLQKCTPGLSLEVFIKPEFGSIGVGVDGGERRGQGRLLATYTLKKGGKVLYTHSLDQVNSYISYPQDEYHRAFSRQQTEEYLACDLGKSIMQDIAIFLQKE